jgi:NADPH:quinone reductase-like Zn-dependent oxidoreductase
MKAAVIHQYGHADVIEVTDIDKPTVSESKVLVKVHASSINPFDTTIREGYMKDAIPLTFPVVLGGDIAGEVSEVGSDVEGLKIGDKVYGQASAVAGNSGAFAE